MRSMRSYFLKNRTVQSVDGGVDESEVQRGRTGEDRQGHDGVLLQFSNNLKCHCIQQIMFRVEKFKN